MADDHPRRRDRPAHREPPPPRRLRAEGKVPGVLYGHGMAPVALTVDRRELRQALTAPAGVNAVIQLKVDGTTASDGGQGDPAPPGAPQRAPRRLHRRAHGRGRSPSTCRCILEGEAEQVLPEGGVIDHLLLAERRHPAAATSPPTSRSTSADLDIGDVIRVGDLILPDGVTTEARSREATGRRRARAERRRSRPAARGRGRGARPRAPRASGRRREG